MLNYLTGKDGSAIIGTGPGALAIIVTNWTYAEKDDTHRSRAAGARGTSRVHLGTDWEANIEGVIVEGDTAPDISALRGAHTAFALKTDETPVVGVTGAGLITEREYGSPIDNNVTVKLKIECDSANAADMPTIAVVEG